jgi:hypothetical protein
MSLIGITTACPLETRLISRSRIPDSGYDLGVESARSGGYTHDGRPIGFAISTAEKTFQSYTFTARNPGGHSSRPRPDNAIYELADALKALQGLSLCADPQRNYACLLRETSER